MMVGKVLYKIVVICRVGHWYFVVDSFFVLSQNKEPKLISTLQSLTQDFSLSSCVWAGGGLI